MPEFWNVARMPDPAPRSLAGTEPMMEEEFGEANMPLAIGSIQVVTNVARFSLALPSRMSSSLTTCNAVRGSTPCSGSRYRGISQLFSRKYTGLMSSSAPDSSSGTRLCSAAMTASLVAAR